MNPCQDAFGSFYGVDGKSSANKPTELLITHRVEATTGFDNCALRVDYRPKDDDVVDPLHRPIITSQFADLSEGRLEAKLARKRQHLPALASLSCIRCIGQPTSLLKFLADSVKWCIPGMFTDSVEHLDRQRNGAGSPIQFFKGLMCDRQRDALSIRLNGLKTQAGVDLLLSIKVL